MTHALAALLPLIELDGALVGQLMLSRPLVVGCLFGLALGRAVDGLLAGALIEAFSAEEPPVGGRVPANPTVAAGVALLLGAPMPAALPAGLFAGWVHALGEQVVRQRRSSLCGAAERGAGWPRVIMSSLVLQAGWTAVVTGAAVLLGGPAVTALWLSAPEFVRGGLELAWKLGPWLAVAILLKAFRRAL